MITLKSLKRYFSVLCLLAFASAIFYSCDKSPTVKFSGTKIEAVSFTKIFPAVMPDVLTVKPNIGSYLVRYSIGKEQKARYGFRGFWYRDQFKT